jgi:hypothetical protein
MGLRKADNGTISVKIEGWFTCLTDWIKMTALYVIGGGIFVTGLRDGLVVGQDDPDGGRWHHACDMWDDSLAVRQVGSGLGQTSSVSDKWMQVWLFDR